MLILSEPHLLEFEHDASGHANHHRRRYVAVLGHLLLRAVLDYRAECAGSANRNKKAVFTCLLKIALLIHQ